MLEFLLQNAHATRGDVREAKSIARRARRRSRERSLRLKERIETLEARQDYYALVLAGVLEALDEDGVLTRERLRATMERVDERDGRVDGRFDPAAAKERGEDDRGLADVPHHEKRHRPIASEAATRRRSRRRRSRRS